MATLGAWCGISGAPGWVAATLGGDLATLGSGLGALLVAVGWLLMALLKIRASCWRAWVCWSSSWGNGAAGVGWSSA
jgi:hypothetical protein